MSAISEKKWRRFNWRVNNAHWRLIQIAVPSHARRNGYKTTAFYDNLRVAPITVKDLSYEQDGFSATVEACRTLGVELKDIPIAVLNIFYSSGIAFAEGSKWNAEDRRAWRHSVITPKK